MITRFLTSIALITATGCNKNNPDESAEDTDSGIIDETDTEPTGFPSSFENGQFRVSSFVILESTQGSDIDGDGEIDNNLESALTPMNLLLEGDFTRAGMNERIAASMDPEVNDLVVLLEAAHTDLQLELQLLTGAVEDATLTVDPRSYDSDGKAHSLLHGEFSTETEFLVETDALVLMIPFYPEQAPLPITLELASMFGSLTTDSATGTLTGVIAGDVLLEQVVDPLIPEEGIDSDGDGVADMTKEQLLETVASILTNESIADIDLGDGRRGISTAFSFGAESSSW